MFFFMLFLCRNTIKKRCPIKIDSDFIKSNKYNTTE